MNDLLNRLKEAKTSNVELDRFISNYMPFIKKEARKASVFQMDFDDRLSVAMLVFMNCVRQYDEGCGAFLPFAAACIRNRLIDEGRKSAKHYTRAMPLTNDENDRESTVGTMLAAQRYAKEQERISLAEEIDLFTAALVEFDMKFETLAKICPKQHRSREQCAAISREIASNSILREYFFRTHRIPQSELARRFKLSEKTIEKHRRYIVAITLILTGDYPGIQAFLPKGGDME